MGKKSLRKRIASLNKRVVEHELKVSRLSSSQKEDILGELSASITHLRIQTELLDKQFDDM